MPDGWPLGTAARGALPLGLRPVPGRPAGARVPPEGPLSPAAVQRAADAYERTRGRQATPVEAMENALWAYRQDAATRARYSIPGHAVALIGAVLRSRGVPLAQARKPGHTLASVLAARDEAIFVARAVCGEEELSYSALRPAAVPRTSPATRSRWR